MRRFNGLPQVFALLLMAFWVAAPLRAEETAQSLSQTAWEAAKKTAIIGPADVPLGDQAKLRVPDRMAFIPKPEASVLMRTWGNGVGDGFMGLVVPVSDGDYWALTVDHTADGYVKDEEAENWNAGELLQLLKDGTEQQNAERAKSGIAALDVIGWIQAPSYDAPNHRLVWSIKLTERGAAAGAPAIINYNTYALGRDGYFALNLLTDEAKVGSDKQSAHTLLAALTYNPGKAYEDFNAETDHMAEYGIAALIGGVAAKKLGLLALAGVFIAKFAKIILIAAAVAGGIFLKFFRRGKSPSA